MIFGSLELAWQLKHAEYLIFVQCHLISLEPSLLFLLLPLCCYAGESIAVACEYW